MKEKVDPDFGISIPRFYYFVLNHNDKVMLFTAERKNEANVLNPALYLLNTARARVNLAALDYHRDPAAVLGSRKFRKKDEKKKARFHSATYNERMIATWIRDGVSMSVLVVEASEESAGRDVEDLSEFFDRLCDEGFSINMGDTRLQRRIFPGYPNFALLTPFSRAQHSSMFKYLLRQGIGKATVVELQVRKKAAEPKPNWNVATYGRKVYQNENAIHPFHSGEIPPDCFGDSRVIAGAGPHRNGRTEFYPVSATDPKCPPLRRFNVYRKRITDRAALYRIGYDPHLGAAPGEEPVLPDALVRDADDFLSLTMVFRS